MSRFEKIAGKLLTWPSLAGLAAVSIVSAVGLGGNPSKAQEKKVDPSTEYTVPHNAYVPTQHIPQESINYSMRMRQITDRMYIDANDAKQCAAEANKEANIQLKNGMWMPKLGDLFLVCTARDKKTDAVRTKNIICTKSKDGASKDGALCSDPDELMI